MCITTPHFLIVVCAVFENQSSIAPPFPRTSSETSPTAPTYIAQVSLLVFILQVKYTFQPIFTLFLLFSSVNVKDNVSNIYIYTVKNIYIYTNTNIYIYTVKIFRFVTYLRISQRRIHKNKLNNIISSYMLRYLREFKQILEYIFLL